LGWCDWSSNRCWLQDFVNDSSHYQVGKDSYNSLTHTHTHDIELLLGGAKWLFGPTTFKVPILGHIKCHMNQRWNKYVQKWLMCMTILVPYNLINKINNNESSLLFDKSSPFWQFSSSLHMIMLKLNFHMNNIIFFKISSNKCKRIYILNFFP
jgi:hypothetical protein